jgi:hypothetical protein
MFPTANVLIPNHASRHCGSFQRDDAENPHGTVREVARDELVRSTEIDRSFTYNNTDRKETFHLSFLF